MLTPEELQERQLKIQTWGMYIGVASLILTALSIFWQTSQERSK